MRKDSLASAAAIVVFTVLLLAIFFPAFAKRPEAPSPDVQALVAAERAFAGLSATHGMKEAFLANLADDAVVFRPGPVPAVAWFGDRPGATGTLTWEPDFAAASAAGDLGYTSGPWEYRDPGAKEGVHGHYVTIWRRQPDGVLKVVLDTGVQHPKPGRAAAFTCGRPANLVDGAPPAADPEAAVSALLAGDRAGASDAASKPWLDVWQQSAAADVRVYRPGEFPVVGKDACRKALAAHAGTLAWSPVAGGSSHAGDLGYTYGTSTFHPNDTAPDSLQRFSYVRIWRQRADGEREIVLDVASPMPRPPAVAKP